MTDLVRPPGPLAPRAPARAGRVYLSRFAKPTSRRAMRASLVAALRALGVEGVEPEDFPWEALDVEHASELRAALVGRYAPASASRHLTAVGGVLRTAGRLRLLAPDRLEDLVGRGGPLSPPKARQGAPAGRMLEPAEVAAAIRAAVHPARPSGAPSRLSTRDAAIVALAAFGGLRRAEIAGLVLADLDRPGRVLRVTGKGDKTRTVPLSDVASAVVEAYLHERGDEPGPLFLRGVRGGGRLLDAGISPSAVYGVIRAACLHLGSPATPHDFRRTFASTLIDAGVDLVTVRDLMGHDSIQTTIRYDRRGDERKRKAAAVLDDVFTGRK